MSMAGVMVCTAAVVRALKVRTVVYTAKGPVVCTVI